MNAKKLFSLLLVFAMAFSLLAACGGGEEATTEEEIAIKNAVHEAAALYKKANETQLAIEAIGEVTENSGEAIAKAENEKYDAILMLGDFLSFPSFAGVEKFAELLKLNPFKFPKANLGSIK